MDAESADISNAPAAPPEVEQAAMLGNTRDAVNLYMRFTGADRATAEAVVARLVEEHS